MPHISRISSEKEAALGQPQLGVKFLADSGIWIVNGTPNLKTVNGETDVQSTETAGF